MATNHGDNKYRRTDSAEPATGSTGRVAALAASVVLGVLVLSLAGPAAASSHTNETTFTATNTDGGVAIGGEDGNSFTFDSGDIVIDGRVTADNSWESTDVEIADQDIQGFAVEATAPNGLQGTFDRERGVFTVEGQILFSTLLGDIPFDVGASTETARGDASLDGTNPEVTVADNSFSVPETGRELVDEQLGLPAASGENSLGITLSLEVDAGDTSDQSDDKSEDDEPDGPQNTDVIVESNNGTQSVRAQVTNARAGESVEVSVSNSGSEDDGDSEDDENEAFEAESISITPRENGDVSVNATASSEQLETTPDQRSGFAPNTTSVGYLSVDTNLADDDIEEFALTTRVNRSRLRELGTDAEAVSLYRFNESQQQWVEQNTTIIDQSDRSVRLRAVADHPSEWTTAAARPEFEIAQTDVEVTAARVGESVAIDVVVENTGGTEGRYRADLLLNGDVVDSQETVIAKGGDALFDFQPAFEEAGTYEVQVNDVAIDQIEVTAEEATTDDGGDSTDGDTDDGGDSTSGDTDDGGDSTDGDTDDGGDSTDGDTDDSADGGGNGFGIVAAVVAVLAAGLYARRHGY